MRIVGQVVIGGNCTVTAQVDLKFFQGDQIIGIAFVQIQADFKILDAINDLDRHFRKLDLVGLLLVEFVVAKLIVYVGIGIRRRVEAGGISV